MTLFKFLSLKHNLSATTVRASVSSFAKNLFDSDNPAKMDTYVI